MSYIESIQWLYSQLPMFQNIGTNAYKPGLGTTLALSSRYGNPHRQFPVIHVAGTNGKGSTAHTLAAILQAAGYKTGLYTSPHLVDFRERIRVNGRMADAEFVERFITDFRDNESGGLNPSFFELTTVMAMRYFADGDVDIAVIETGLGGRLDSTNIVSPLVSVITNISLDHTALLGKTEPEIAQEKAGIIKPLTPVVVGRAGGEVRQVLSRRAAEMNAPIFFAELEHCYTSVTRYPDSMLYRGTRWGDIQSELIGDCQPENAATIMATLPLLDERFPSIDACAVAEGFAKVTSMTGLMGRWMSIEGVPVKTIADTGHNVGAWQYLGPRLENISTQNGTLRMVLGFVNDKDINSIAKLLPHDAVYYFATPSVSRGRQAADTRHCTLAAGIDGRCFDTVHEAYRSAIDESKPDDTIYIGGSTFVVADFLNALNAGLL